MALPLSILIYHRVQAVPDPLFPEEVDLARFEQHLRLLTRWFRLLPLSEAVRRLRDGTLPARAACITFDDGYADCAAATVPLLRRYRASATFFVASGFIDGGCMWNDAVVEVVRKAPGDRLNLARAGFGVYDIGCAQRRRAVIAMLIRALTYLTPEERIARIRRMADHFTPTMLSSDELLALHRAGMEIGAKTVSHPILTSISNAQARNEIANGRARLQDLIQAPVTLFAYPNGKPGADFEQRHMNMLRRQGFEAAVSTACGAAWPGADPYCLPRFTPWDRGNASFLLRMACNMFMPQG